MKIRSIEELVIAIKEAVPNVEISINGRVIEGKIKNNTFEITYVPNKNTAIRVDESGTFIIDQLSSVLSCTGNGTDAVLTYDTVRTNSKREHVVIWSSLAPKEALYNAIIANTLIPLPKLQTKVMNVRLYNTETKAMEHVSEEDIASLYKPVAVGGTIKRLIKDANLDGLAEKAEDAAKKVVAGATMAADVVVGMLGGKEKINKTFEDGKKLAVELYTNAKTKAEAVLGDIATGIENLKDCKDASVEKVEEAVAETTSPVQNVESEVKISGLYPGNMKSIVDHIEALDEAELYLLLEMAIANKRSCIYELTVSGNSIEARNKCKEASYAEEYLIYCTRKFGVDIPDAVEGQKVSPANESFISWLDYLRGYFNSLTKSQKEDFEYRKQTGADTSMYKPAMSWKEYNNIVELKMKNGGKN